ncbi:MAG: response regulator [Candidatus Omnitrophica bacterium]|nr:response regulator [Candidatus Omnitrophota bacterium]
MAVDDELEFIEMLKEYFELRGYEIHVASKAVQGIELINNKNPDIAILDLKMPGISGDEILGLLKSKQPKTKVIFVTAFDDAGKTKARMLNAGAYAYLDKPLNSLKVLEDVISKAYSGKSLKEDL